MWQLFCHINVVAAVHFLLDFQAANIRELGALQWGQNISNGLKLEEKKLRFLILANMATKFNFS